MRRKGLIYFTLVFLFTSLACRAATRLIIPDTPVADLTSTSIPFSPSTTISMACPDELASIMDASSGNPQLSGLSGADTRNPDVIPLVTYTVNGDQIGDPIIVAAPISFRAYQRDYALQEQSWKLFTEIIPAAPRKLLKVYQVITDGPENVLAAVKQTSKDPTSWVLEIDIADAGNTKNLVYTLIHEFGHLLTLNSSQVPPDLKVFNNSDDNHIYNQESNACPDYFTGEGCSLPESYINTFFSSYWTGLYDEWLKIDNIENDQRRQDKLDLFYDKYRDQFVDDYAVTNPAEDIAESWAFFVLSPKPEGQAISDQKILFFYNYPELVQLRSQIQQSLCAANP